jgi:hypothetical protein
MKILLNITRNHGQSQRADREGTLLSQKSAKRQKQSGGLNMADEFGEIKKPRWPLWLAAFFLTFTALFALYIWLALTWSFSTGERVGYIQKLSRSGWICKTWEGEMAMVTMPGAIPDKFLFSIREDKVANRINQLAGKRVALVYEQHKGLPTSCFGDTEYFIVDARAVQ